MTAATIRLRVSDAGRAKAKVKELIRSIVSERQTKAKQTFFAFFANHFLRLQYRAYLQKAKTGGDEWDETWNELNPKTVADKKREGVAHPEWINVRTGRLLAALEPLTESNGRLYMRKDMQVSISGQSVIFTITIPYSDRVDAVRSLFALAEDLIARAAEKALVDTLKTILPTERL